MPADPMTQLLQLVAQARANRIRRAINDNAASGAGTTKDGSVPAEAPRPKEAQHGTT